MSVNFAKNQDEITNAWRKVIDEKDKPNWALFGYEGNTNNIRLMSTGVDGLASLVHEFNCSLIQYAVCRVIDAETNVNKLILINWQGDSSPLSRKGLCASHVGDVANYFKGATQTITIRNDDETSVDYLMSQIKKSGPNRIDACINSKQQVISDLESDRMSSKSANPDQPISKSQKDVEIQIAKDRKTFWQIQEEEEKLRLLEEKKRAAEKLAQFEKERTLREQSEAKKLAETVKERDRFIEATRKAERRESSSSMSSKHSFSSYNGSSNNDDDERVGMRSELIRLERNQETQSLINKGQIKNRRALFEKACQQESLPSSVSGSTLSRRANGAMIKQRLNAFQSLESQSTTQEGARSVNKIVDRINCMNITDEETKPKSNVIVTSAIESVKLTKNDETETESKCHLSSSTPIETKKQATNGFSTPPEANEIASNKLEKDNEAVEVANVEDEEEDNFEYQRELEENKKKEVEIALSQNGRENGQGGCSLQAGDQLNESGDDAKLNGESHNENNNHIMITKSSDELQAYRKIVDAIMANEDEVDKAKAKAVAIYDYQAADKTEISFDPNDFIGFIEKVDVGWWHGVVISGKYAGQRGLFPHNHVMEL